MTPINNAQASSFLRHDLLKHLAEVLQLECGKPPVPTTAFADAESPSVVMLVSDMPWGVAAFLSNHDHDFTTRALRHLTGLHNSFTLSSLDPGVFRSQAAQVLLTADDVQCYPSLAFTGTLPASEPDPRCRRLCSDDADLFRHYPQEAVAHGAPSHSDLFAELVLEQKGEVFGFIDDEGLAGYLACAKEVDNVWDVAFVHVVENKRDSGVGTQLAKAYATRRLELGQIAYYSGPTAASERAAIKAGFVRCRELLSAEVSTAA
jgi:hypothetical protein